MNATLAADSITVEYTIDSRNLDAITHEVDKANRRAERNGIAARFAVRLLDVFMSTPTTEAPMGKPMARIEIDRPEAKLGDWIVLASVELEEGGTVLRIAEGHSLQGFDRPDAHTCDHCGTRRNRKHSYILRNVNDASEVIQVGRSCLTVFTGLDLSGLWALTALTAEALAEMDEDTEGGGRNWSAPSLFPVRWVIAAAAEVSTNGAGYVSKAAAHQGRPSTSSLVQELFYFRPIGRNPEYNAEMLALGARVAERVEQNDPIIEAALDAVRAMKPSSDYADNMLVIANSEHISHRSLGYAVSAVAVYYRSITDEAERQAKYDADKAERAISKGWIGEAGEKLTDIVATITGWRVIEGDWGNSHLLTLRTESHHIVKWFASNPDDSLEVGNKVRIVRATVKKQDRYEGQDQTVVTRAKLELIEA